MFITTGKTTVFFGKWGIIKRKWGIIKRKWGIIKRYPIIFKKCLSLYVISPVNHKTLSIISCALFDVKSMFSNIFSVLFSTELMSVRYSWRLAVKGKPLFQPCRSFNNFQTNLPYDLESRRYYLDLGVSRKLVLLDSGIQAPWTIRARSLSAMEGGSSCIA